MIYNYARALQVGISYKKAFQITSNLLYKEKMHSRLYFLRFPALPAFFASLPRSNIPWSHGFLQVLSWQEEAPTLQIHTE